MRGRKGNNAKNRDERQIKRCVIHDGWEEQRRDLREKPNLDHLERKQTVGTMSPWGGETERKVLELSYYCVARRDVTRKKSGPNQKKIWKKGERKNSALHGGAVRKKGERSEENLEYIQPLNISFLEPGGDNASGNGWRRRECKELTGEVERG